MTFPSLRPFALFLSISSFAILFATGDDFDNVLSAKVSDLGIKGAAIAFFDKNTMEDPVTRGYGNISSDDDAAAVTPDTVFMLASASKPFAASAVAVLVDKGIISSIDDDICDVIPLEQYSQQMCRNQKFPSVKITWRMLLTHRSSMIRGLPEAKDQSGHWISPAYGPSGGYTEDSPGVGNPTCPLDDIINFYHVLLTGDPGVETTVGAGVVLQGGEDLNWYDLARSEGGMWADYRPGSLGEYSNVAYGYIPALVEFATGQSFPDFCNENLFDPLGMDKTAWFREDLPADTLEAIPVKKLKNGDFEDIGHYCFIDYASGSLHSSANDLARWGDAMLEYGTALWSKNIGREVVNCQERDVNNEPIEQIDCEFGYGWILLSNLMKSRALETSAPSGDESTVASTDSSSTNSTNPPSNGETTEDSWWLEAFTNYDWTDGIWHDGSESGCQTNILILPKAGLYVAVITNTDGNSDTAAQELTEAVVSAHLSSSSLEKKKSGDPAMDSSSISWMSPVSLPSLLIKITALSLASHLFTHMILL